jgi:hypothetical protein
MKGASIVVRACAPGQSNSGDYQFRKNDLGVVDWQRHENLIIFWQPLVTWDDDPDKKPRQVIIEYLEVVGLQTNGCRLQLDQVSGLLKTR